MGTMPCSLSPSGGGKVIFEYAVALTGGIATGKSTVVKMLAQSGFHVIDADKIAHEVLDAQHVKIAALFGERYVSQEKVDRKALGDLVFSNAQKRKALEALLHPLIYTEIALHAAKLDKKTVPYLIDIPLFYEGGRYAIDNVIVVYAHEKQQKQRLMEREGLTEKEALSRIAAQIDIEEKRKNASYLIDNSGTLAQLSGEVARIKEEILENFSWK